MVSLWVDLGFRVGLDLGGVWSWPGVELRLGVVRWALAGGGVDGWRRG